MDVDSLFGLRWPQRYTAWLMGAWVALICFISISHLDGYLDYFAERDARFRWGLGVALVTLACASWGYALIRRKGLWRWEPSALLTAGFTLVIAYEPVGALTVVALGCASYALGRELLARTDLEFDSNSSELALSLGVGLGAIIVVLIPVGLLGFYNAPVFAVVVVAPLVVLRHRLGDLWRNLRQLNSAWGSLKEGRTVPVGIAVFFLAFFELVFLFAAVTPTISRDAISYHVPAAQYYAETGYLQPVPGLDYKFGRYDLFSQGHADAYSYYPQSYEEILTLALSLGDWAAMQFTEPLFYLLALLAIAATGKAVGLTRFQRLIGVIGAVSLPFAHWSGSTIKNDMAMASFQLLALYCVIESKHRRPAVWLVLTSAFLGLSFGVKHIAIFGGIPIGLMMLWGLFRRSDRWKLLAVTTVVFAMCGTFWHARAYVMKGSPVYPANVRVAVTQFNATDTSEQDRSIAYLTYPWIAHFEGGKVIELPMSTPCGLFIAMLLVAWPLTRRKTPSPTFWPLLIYFGLYYVYWVWVWGVLRYGIAPFLVVALLAGGRAAALWAASSAMNRKILNVALTLGLLGSVAPLLIIEINPPQLRYLAGSLDRDAYWEASNRFYPSVRELNRIMDRDQVAIGVSNCARAYALSPTMLQCLELGRMTDRERSQTDELLRGDTWHYLLAPHFAMERGLAPIAAELNLRQMYSDDIYGIYANPAGGSE